MKCIEQGLGMSHGYSLILCTCAGILYVQVSDKATRRAGK